MEKIHEIRRVQEDVEHQLESYIVIEVEGKHYKELSSDYIHEVVVDLQVVFGINAFIKD